MRTCGVCDSVIVLSLGVVRCDTCGRLLCADCIDYDEQLRDDTDTICVPCAKAQKTRRWVR